MSTAKSTDEYELPPIQWLTHEEALEVFDARAREIAGMSGEEFLRRWDAGEFPDPDGTPLMRLVMLIPLCGRPISVAERE